MRKLKIVVFAIIVLFFILSFSLPTLIVGLINSQKPTDVTTSPGYNFLSFSGTVWKTKVKLALSDEKEYTGAHHLYLLAPKRFDPTQPDYLPPPGKPIFTILPVGTHVRIARLIKDNGEGSLLWITGTLIDTTNSGKTVYFDELLLQNNRYIARGPTSSTNWEVNPDMLEKP